MCAEYEYQPVSVSGTGHGTANMQVRTREPQRPLGLLPAARRNGYTRGGQTKLPRPRVGKKKR